MPKTFHGEAYGAFVERLIVARRGAGMTQADLAARLGRHQSFVSNFESRIRRLDIVEAVVIAKIIGIDPVSMIAELSALIGADTVI